MTRATVITAAIWLAIAAVTLAMAHYFFTLPPPLATVAYPDVPIVPGP